MGFWSTSRPQKKQNNSSAVVYGYPTQPQFDPQLHSEPHYLLLQPAPSPPFWRKWVSTIIFFFFLILLAGGTYYFWPDDPHVEVVRLHLNKIDLRTEPRGLLILPRIFLDVNMGLTVKVTNKDNFGIYYKSLNVGIGYRGKKIGWMRSEGSYYIPARGSAYVDATLELDGIEVLSDVFYWLEDIARGHVPLQTETHFNGYVRLLFFNVPLQAVVTCNIDVDLKKQSILRQDCDIGSCC